MSFKEKITDIADGLRKIRRAMQGISLEEEKFPNMIDEGDIRERTRGSPFDLYARSFMRLLDKAYHEELEIYKDIADMDDHYFIAENGEQRKEAILMQRARISPSATTTQQFTLEQVQTKPEEKKGLFSRKKGEPESNA